MILRALLCLAALLLGGCAGTLQEKAIFSLGADLPKEARGVMWPPQSDGEVPRYFYAGELRGETNFIRPKREGEDAKTLFLKFFDVVIGVDLPVLLDRPQSGTVDELGRIMVTDIGRASVFVFDVGQGRLVVWDLAEGLTRFVAPVGIARGPDGQTLVADAELGLVARLDRDGNPKEPIGKGKLLRPTGVAYEAATGQIFVADTEAHQIKIFDLAGELLQTIGQRGDGAGEFNYPTHIAIFDEKLYVTDTMNARIQVLSTATGRYLGTIGKRGLFVGNMVRPKGVAVDSENNIYVVESYFDYLLVYNRRGEFLMPIGGVGDGAGSFHLPAGVWIDSKNRIFVADMLNNRVAVFQYMGGEIENDW